MANSALQVWMNGERVGLWVRARAGTSVWRYDDEWTTSPNARALSLSLPLTDHNQEHRGAAVAHYFENLLPDNAAILKRLRVRFRTASTEAFDLLSEIGRDWWAPYSSCRRTPSHSAGTASMPCP